MKELDHNAVKARLEVIVDALELPHDEVGRAMSCDEELISFAARHGQSLDYIWLGDIKPMLRSRAIR